MVNMLFLSVLINSYIQYLEVAGYILLYKQNLSYIWNFKFHSSNYPLFACLPFFKYQNIQQ